MLSGENNNFSTFDALRKSELHKSVKLGEFTDIQQNNEAFKFIPEILRSRDNYE